jgi:hypothetical protein
VPAYPKIELLPPEQARAITRYRFGLVGTRPRGVPKITMTGPHRYMYARWTNFDRWFLFRFKSDRRLRPADVWRRVPSWDHGFYTPWDLAAEMLKRWHDAPPQPLPPRPPPAGKSYSGIRHVAVMAQDTDGVILSVGPGMVAAFTADPAYDDWASSGRVQAHVSAGHVIAAWCNPSQVSVQRLRDFGARIGARHLIGQCETAGEFDDSMAGGLTTQVGNLSSLRDDQLEVIRSRADVHIANEDYWNVQPWLVPNWRGLPVTSCPAVYGGSETPSHRYWPLREYEAAGRLVPGAWVYQPGMTADDAAVYARLVARG